MAPVAANCLDSNGVILDHLTEEEAKEVVDANSTAILNPSASEYGICVCAVTHRHDPKVDTCVPRAEGTVCKSTYACTVKLPMSRCVTGQCKCAPDTKYDAMTDRCNFEDKMAADVDVVCFFEDHCLTMRAASGLGFFLSAMLISLIAMCLCACARQCRSKGHRHERLIDRHIDFSSIFDDKPRDKYEGNFGVGRSSDYTMDGAQDGRY
ncbi:hypothetical protein HDE_07892 [Halotydeus destructor]|nr:hypothetical protein HDE_07892 [Halotydeus destructor]